MSFDLNLLKPVMADDGAVLNIVHPETEEVIEGMTITVLGQDSKIYRKLQLGKQQAALNRMSKGKKALDLDAEKLSEDSIDDLVKITIGWTGLSLDKKELEFTPENVRTVYTEWAWIKEQVQEFVGNRANFFRANG
tara:strand:+ start:1982 stop:2389 length:408 start_codon:yes stop_codon:yes gene_type:complete